jgi:hypothetical protein
MCAVSDRKVSGREFTFSFRASHCIGGKYMYSPLLIFAIALYNL